MSGVGARRCRAVVVAFLLLSSTACGEDPGAVRSREIIEDLAAQEYGRASSRYRQFENEVLAPGAAPVWRRALEHQDPTVREWAVDTLSRIADAEDVDVIAERLRDPSRGVRQQAVAGLLRLDRDRAVSEFRALLADDRPEAVVLGAQGLAEAGEADAAAAIRERFEDATLPDATRAALTQPLAALGDPASAAALADVAADAGADTQLRRLAAEALVTLEGPSVREQVARLAGSDDEYVAALAAEALRSPR